MPCHQSTRLLHTHAVCSAELAMTYERTVVSFHRLVLDLSSVLVQEGLRNRFKSRSADGSMVTWIALPLSHSVRWFTPNVTRNVLQIDSERVG